MKKTVLIAVMGLLVTMTASAAHHRGPMSSDPEERQERRAEMHARHLERMESFLDLSAQQVEEWNAIREERVDAMRIQHEESLALHERMEALIGSEAPDAQAIGELMIEVHERRDRGKADMKQLHEELQKVLTPEQRERFEAFQDLKGHRGRRGHHRRLGSVQQ